MKTGVKSFLVILLVLSASIEAGITTDLISNKPLPTVGIISAHPGRVERMAKEFLQDVEIHTDYRGYKIYTGRYRGELVFAAYTAMGGPSVAMILENLALAGAKKIVRVGTSDNDNRDQERQLNTLFLISETRGLRGMMEEYGFSAAEIGTPLQASASLTAAILAAAQKSEIDVTLTKAYNIDAFHVYSHPERFAKNAQVILDKIAAYQAQGATVRDMESGTLFMIAHLRGIEAATLLIPRIKNNIETQDSEKTTVELEGRAIKIVLEALVTIS